MRVKPFLKDIKEPEVVKTGDQDGWRYDDWSELHFLKQDAANGTSSSNVSRCSKSDRLSDKSKT